MRISDWSSDVCSSDLVVRPDDCPGIAALGFEDVLERLEHVRVAQVPAFGAAIIHDTVIALGEGGTDRKSVVEGKSVSVRVDLGGRRIIKKKNMKTHTQREINIYTKKAK